MVKKATRKGLVYISAEPFWEIPEVTHRGEVHTCRLYDRMTPPMNYPALVKYAKDENKKGNPVPISSDLLIPLVSRACDLKDSYHNEAESLRQFIYNGLKKFPNTLSELTYFPSGNGKVVHNKGLPTEYEIRGKNLIGNDYIIEENISDDDANMLEMLFGTKNVKEINKFSNWINSTPIRLWRLNSKPFKQEKRVVGFDASPRRVALVANGDLHDEFPAFRVSRVE